MRALKRASGEVAVATSESLTSASDSLTNVTQVVKLSLDSNLASRVASIWKLRQLDVDLVVLPWDGTPNWIRWISPVLFADVRVACHIQGAKRAQAKWLSLIASLRPRHFFVSPWSEARHESQLNLDLVQQVVGTEFSMCDSLMQRSDLRYVPATVEQGPYIALQPSARNGTPTLKTWHPSRFLDLIHAWHERHPYIGIVLLGDEGDRRQLELSGDFNNAPCLNLMGKTSWQEVLGLVSGARGLVCHDSGLMHLGDLLGTPLVALYGVHSFYPRTHPRNPTSRAIKARKCPRENDVSLLPGLGEDDLTNLFPNHSDLDPISVEEVLFELEHAVFGAASD